MIVSASSRPVTGASVIPSIACPVATCSMSQPDTGPITGSPSGVIGRSPAQVAAPVAPGQQRR